MSSKRRSGLAVAVPSTPVSLGALAVVVVASVAMEQGASALGVRYGIAEIVVGALVLAAVTSLPNAVAAVYLARRGRGAATFSTALNSNAINVTAGLLIPATVIGVSQPSGSGLLVAGWYLGLTAVTCCSPTPFGACDRKSGLDDHRALRAFRRRPPGYRIVSYSTTRATPNLLAGRPFTTAISAWSGAVERRSPVRLIAGQPTAAMRRKAPSITATSTSSRTSPSAQPPSGNCSSRNTRRSIGEDGARRPSSRSSPMLRRVFRDSNCRRAAGRSGDVLEDVLVSGDRRGLPPHRCRRLARDQPNGRPPLPTAPDHALIAVVNGRPARRFGVARVVE